MLRLERYKAVRSAHGAMESITQKTGVQKKRRSDRKIARKVFKPRFTDEENFTREQFSIITRTTPNEMHQKYLHQTFDPLKIRNVKDKEFAQMCRTVIREIVEKKPVSDSHVANESHPLWQYLRNETREDFNFQLSNYIASKEILKCSRHIFLEICKRGMGLNVYPNTPLGKVLHTKLLRNVGIAYSVRERCCDHPTIIMERMTTKIITSAQLCKHHSSAIQYANSHFKINNAVKKFPFCGSDISNSFSLKMKEGNMKATDWAFLYELSASYRMKLDVDTLEDYWRIGVLFEHNSLSYAEYLGKLIRQHVSFEAQGVFDYVTGGIFKDVPTVIQEAHSVLKGVNEKIVDETGAILTFIREQIKNVCEVKDALAQLSSLMAVGTTLVGLTYVYNFTEILSQLNVLYNLLPFKVSFTEILSSACSTSHSLIEKLMTANTDMEAQGLLDFLPSIDSSHNHLLTQIAWGILCAGISGKIANETSLKGFIGKYGLSQMRGFGFDALFSYVKNGDASSRIVEFLQDFLNLCGFDFMTWNRLLASFDRILSIAEEVRCYLRSNEDLSSFSMKDNATELVDQWIREVDQFQLLFASNLRSFMQGRQSQCMTMTQTVQQLKRELVTIKQKVVFNVQHNRNVNQAIWIDFVGASGIGKTWTLKNRIFPILQEKCNLSNLYVRAKTKHFDGHSDETCFLYDDYNQMDDDKAKEIFELCSGCPMILPKASVEEKGVAIIPQLVFTTANTPNILKVSKVASLEAFERRRTYLFETRLNPSDCPLHNAMPDFMSCGKVSCGRTADLKNLQYRSKPTFSRMWSTKQCGDWMSFDQFLPTLIKLVKQHQESVQVIDKDEFEAYYCNMDNAVDLPSYCSTPCFEQPSTFIDVDIPNVHVGGETVKVNVEVPTEEVKGVTPFSGLRVFSHNLNGFKDARIDKELIFLEQSQFDIICFQEVSASQLKALRSLEGYKVYTLGRNQEVTMVVMVKRTWKCKRTKPVIVTERGVLSLDFGYFTVTNLHLKHGEQVFYPTDSNHVFCGDVQGNVPDLHYASDEKFVTWGDKTYDIIGSSSDILYQYECLGAFQSDHSALSARIALFEAQGEVEIYAKLDVWELARSFSKSKIKAILSLLTGYRKVGTEIFSYLWEDSMCSNIQACTEGLDNEFLSNPALVNVIFAFLEFALYYQCKPDDSHTLGFLFARLHAFMMHVTQPEDILCRMARHVSFNSENWENKSTVEWVFTILKYALSGDYSNLSNLVSYPLPTNFTFMKEFKYNGLSFIPQYFSESFSSTCQYVHATVCDAVTWVSLNTDTSFYTKFLSTCCNALNISVLLSQLKGILMDWVQYLKKQMLEHPILAAGGLLLFIGGAYILSKMSNTEAKARIVSYDDMYNIVKPKEEVTSYASMSNKDEDLVYEKHEEFDFLASFDSEEEVERVRRDKKRGQGEQVSRLNTVIQSVEANMCTVTVNGYSLGGIFIGGTTLMVPKHFLEGSKAKGVQLVNLKFGGEPLECFLDFDDMNQCVKCPGMDVMFMHFPCNRIQARKRLINHFMFSSQLKNIASEDICLLTRDNQAVNRFQQRFSKGKRELDFAYGIGDKRVICNIGLRYRVNTSPGDCGSCVLMDNNAYNSIIYGFHVAGSTKVGHGFGQAISREIVEKALSHFKDFKSPPTFIANGFVREEALRSCDNARVEPGNREKAEGNFSYIGTLPLSQVPYMPSKTDLVETPLYGKIAKSAKAPACLRPKEINGQLIHPMKASLDKYAVPLRAFDPSLLNRIKEYNILKYKAKATALNHNFSLYSEKENILGREDGLGRIPSNTSTGYPYTVKGIKKLDCFDYEEGIILNDELREDILETEARMKQGIHSGHVWTDCLKDEKRSLEKVEACKTRTFAIPSVTISYLTRKYFGSVVDFLTKCRIDTSFTIGINPEGPEWTALFAKHNSHSGNVVAGDYSRYDGTTPPEMIMVFADFCNALCENSDGEFHEENSMMRRQICSELSHTLHLCENLLYYTHQGIPSGSPLTVYINSAIGDYLVMYAYLELARDANVLASLTTWEKHVSLSTYGDDNLMTISDEAIGWFNFSTLKHKFSEYGITYTPESKDDSEYISKSIYDVSFLKRKFVRDSKDKRKILAPIDESSINELFNWCRKSTNLDETLYLNVEDAFRKAHAHGRYYFNNLLEKVNTVLMDMDMEQVTPSWEELDYLWRSQFF